MRHRGMFWRFFYLIDSWQFLLIPASLVTLLVTQFWRKDWFHAVAGPQKPGPWKKEAAWQQ